jgi:hypothetical protein
MGVTIRKARIDDARAFQDLRLEALRGNPTVFSADYAVNLALPQEHWTERLRQLDDQTSALFFAEDVQELAGMGGIVRGSSPKTMHSGMIYGV